jgi:L-alanine-DL-glutamate epimerase-like enolase superfamily enzyme
MIEWLAEKNVKLVEQPLPVDHLDDIAWLNEQSPLPIFADEAVQRLCDLKNVEGVYSGINIKLMKSTGLNEAYKMILLAKEMGLQTMLGCMTETSCAISAAAQISSLVNWADLDGAMLISNDIFDGMKIINGKITLPERNGIGIVKKLV